MAVRTITPLRVLASPVKDARVSTEIYRPFFLAGILSVLTAGCTLGAVALLGIANQASYTTSVWTPYVLAHANSQLYGWVGFFVMGFALQQHAPRASRAALFRKLAVVSLTLMAIGVGIRFAAEPLVHTNPGVWMPIGIGSCILQAVAVGLFLVNTWVTRYRTEEGLTWPTLFVFASLTWLSLVAVAEPFYFALSHQADQMQSVLFVAEYFPPYREAQFLGFVTMMIFGVAFVKLHSCFGAEEACPYFGSAGFVLWTSGLVCRMLGWVLFFRSGMQASGMYTAAAWMLAAGALCLVISSRIYRKLEFSLPSHKFIRAAMAWLLVAGILMIMEPAHLAATGLPFSHAFIGGIRHAVTVGFISQMILGIALHVVGRMNDIPIAKVPSLWLPFILLNFGNAGRVFLEIATDYSPLAFRPMGFTGFIELTGLALWAIAVARPMLASWRKSYVTA